jgi:5'-nucleotidase / UDP-sugar diphosphatase
VTNRSGPQMRRAIGLTLVVALLAALFTGAAPVLAQEDGGFTLTILHTNDTHAHIEQYDGSTTSCSAESDAAGECIGGVARRATEIERVRSGENGANVILVDAGDPFQGTLFYSEYKGAEAAQFMNALGYQAMAVGNHEYDDGPANLAAFIDAVEFPVLSANTDAENSADLAGKIEPYTIIELSGEQVGVVGLTTKDTPIISSSGPDVQFSEYVESLEPIIEELGDQGVNKIVLLSHIGYADDLTLAAAIDGVDVIVGGHSHTLLSNTDEDAFGPYPTVVDSPSGDPVLVVSAEAYGKYLGELDVTFDDAGVAVSWEGEPVLLDASIEQDPEILAQVQELAEPVEELRSQVIGSTTTDLVGDRSVCRFEECNMGNLVADAMRAAVANEGVQIVITNGGGIRSSLSAGDITLGGVLEVLPFNNTVATFGLRGADVMAALENGVSRAENPGNEGTGRFPQVSGLRFAWDGSKPVGERIVSVEVEETDGTFSPLDLEATYQLASNNFNRTGGDDYSMFAEDAIDPYDFGPTLSEVVADYIQANSPLTVELDGRISRLDDPAATLAALATPEPAATEAVEATVEPTVEATIEATVEATAEVTVEATVEATPEVTAEATPEELPTTGVSGSWPLAGVAVFVILGLVAAEFARQRSNTRK